MSGCNLLFLLALTISKFAVNFIVAYSDCLFAQSYNISVLFKSPLLQDEFLIEASIWEGKFARHGFGVNVNTGLTRFGVRIHLESGASTGRLRADVDFTRPEAEAAHLSLLTLALDGDKFAIAFFNSSIEGQRYGQNSIDDFIIDQLTKKISSYFNFNLTYPGFGGYFPSSLESNELGLRLLNDDFGFYDLKANVIDLYEYGKLPWAMVAAAQVLEERGQEILAAKFHDYLNLLRSNSLMLFYNTTRDVIISSGTIKNPFAKASAINFKPSSAYSLHDPWTGELQFMFSYLYGNWTQLGGKETKTRSMIAKRQWLKQDEQETNKGNITVEKGLFFAAEEKWKYLLLPYFDVAINERVFLNGEAARSQWSALNKLPGLFATTNAAGSLYDSYLSFYSAGISRIAFLQSHNDTIAPYAAFPMLLHRETRSYGVAWYASMLQGPRMQGPLGASECLEIHGAREDRIPSLALTWPFKTTAVVAFAGGLGKITGRYLNRTGKLHEFYALVDREWTRVFGGKLKGSKIGFALPTVKVSDDGSRFQCQRDITSPMSMTFTYCYYAPAGCFRLIAGPYFSGTGLLFVSVVLYINLVKNRNEHACHKYFIGHLFFAHLLQVSTQFVLDVMYGVTTPKVYFRPLSAYWRCTVNFLQNFYLPVCFTLMSSVALLCMATAISFPVKFKYFFTSSIKWHLYMVTCHVLAIALTFPGFEKCGDEPIQIPATTNNYSRFASAISIAIATSFLLLLICAAYALTVAIRHRRRIESKIYVKLAFSLLAYSVIPLIWCFGGQIETIATLIAPAFHSAFYLTFYQLARYSHLTFAIVHSLSTLFALSPYRRALWQMILFLYRKGAKVTLATVGVR